MVPLLFATGFSFLASDSNVRVRLVSTLLVLYTWTYSPGGGVVPFLYTSEIFPTALRGKLRIKYTVHPLYSMQLLLMCRVEVDMAWGSAVTFFGASILALVVPQLISAIGHTALLGLFA